jgi:putative ABC transport system ATP-binding protein
LPNEAPIASFRDLTKSYRTATARVEALKGISADLPAGALTAIVGPSGSGKSTLLRLLAGMDRPTAGAISIRGTRVQAASARERRRLRRSTVGYVFQRPSDNFVPHLSVVEHLRLASLGSGVRNHNAEEILETLGIAHRVDHLPSELSGGEQQRAALAQALVGTARIVLADEPTAELDTDAAGALLSTIHALAREGITFVIATHDPDVTRRAEVVLELAHGMIRERGRANRRPGVAIPPPEPHERDWPPVLEVRGLTKTYRRGEESVHALADVTLEQRSGEITALIGRSGSGKTTLLNAIAGWEPPDSGEIVWSDGVGVSGSPAWSDLAVLPQKFGLLDELTVRENIEYPARLAGRVADLEDTIDEILDALLLIPLRNRYPRETSVGEQQRTALARAVVLSPRVLLADEPTSHQDERSAEAALNLLRRTADQGMACLLATHSDEVLPYVDRLLRMEDGRTIRGPD